MNCARELASILHDFATALPIGGQLTNIFLLVVNAPIAP